jgi:chaperone modulatory protein CbpM
MSEQNLFLGVLIEDDASITYVEICHKYNISEDLLNDMVEHGLLPAQTNQNHQASLDQSALRRMETAFRLHRDLDINLPGVALALDLLEEMKAIRSELDILSKHF